MVIGVGLDQQQEADKRDSVFYLETTERQYHEVYSLEINTLPLIWDFQVSTIVLSRLLNVQFLSEKKKYRMNREKHGLESVSF